MDARKAASDWILRAPPNDPQRGDDPIELTNAALPLNPTKRKESMTMNKHYPHVRPVLGLAVTGLVVAAFAAPAGGGAHSPAPPAPPPPPPPPPHRSGVRRLEVDGDERTDDRRDRSSERKRPERYAWAGFRQPHVPAGHPDINRRGDARRVLPQWYAVRRHRDGHR